MKKFHLLLGFLCLLETVSAQLPIVNGWTQFSLSPDSRILYVSDSDGNDATGVIYNSASPEVTSDPFHPTASVQAYKTIAAAFAHIRTGFPDWILLKNGDTFANQSFGTINRSGKNKNEPILIGAYGVSEDRPLILTGASNLISFTGSASHVAIVGLQAVPHTRSGTDEPSAVYLLNSPFESFLIENCYFDSYFMHIVAQDYVNTTTYTHRNFTARRNVLTNAYKIGGGGGGVYMHQIDSILFEDNLIDHNGWNESVAGATASGFSHNTYFQSSCRNLIFRNNIVSRASAVGIGARCGGQITNNLLLSNPRNLFVGSFDQGQINWPTVGVSGEVAHNVILDARPESFDGGNGITIDRVRKLSIHHNIVAHFTASGSYNIGIGLDHIDSVYLKKNIVYNWANNQTTGPNYASGVSFGTSRLNSNRIDSNDVQLKNTQAHCISTNGTFANLQFRDNRYHNVVSANNWFGNGNFTTWETASGEQNALQQEVNYLDPNRSIATYLTSISETGGLSEFITLRKNMTKAGWNEQLTASAVNSYIRIGFGMEEEQTAHLAEANEQTICVFPNPSSTRTFHIESNTKQTAKIYSLTGAHVASFPLEEGMNTISVPQHGVYLLEVASKRIKLVAH